MEVTESRADTPRRLGPLLFAVVLAATVAAAVVALSARGPDLELEVSRLSSVLTPDRPGRHRVAHIKFFVRDSDPAARVLIVAAGGGAVRTLDRSASLKAGVSVTYVWRGDTNAGEPAPPGDYRLRVVLPGEDRDMVYPRRIELQR